MSEIESRCLEAFPQWLRALPDDARALAGVLDIAGTTAEARRAAAAALNYLFKSLDLIPDGIEDLGFIDDAFVLRVASAHAVASGVSDEPFASLGSAAALISEFLGSDYARLESYVRGLAKGSARGRSVDDVLADAGVRSELVGEVRAWADAYAAPAFQRDAKNLVKLKSFLLTKLPK